ncbi:MAG: DUF3108 domain-containing protein [Cardiobacteriaceae bacterium]|nr:DUF3108 domain-containing protein [Cardiobacteriaceae bacterium]
MKMRIRYMLAIIAFFCSITAAALQSYIAEYDLTVRGVGAGRVRHEVFFTDKSYRIETTGTPSLAARMLGFGQIREKAEGKIVADKIMPVSYRREMQGKENQFLSYDYADAVNGQIHAIVGSESKVLRVNPNEPALDILALVAQSLLDVERGRIDVRNYTLISEDRVRSYQISTLPNETWKDINNNKIIKVKVFLQTSGNRQTKIYFAEEPLRLVKLQQLKDGESHFTLKLLNYKVL